MPRGQPAWRDLTGFVLAGFGGGELELDAFARDCLQAARAPIMFFLTGSRVLGGASALDLLGGSARSVQADAHAGTGTSPSPPHAHANGLATRGRERERNGPRV